MSEPPAAAPAPEAGLFAPAIGSSLGFHPGAEIDPRGPLTFHPVVENDHAAVAALLSEEESVEAFAVSILSASMFEAPARWSAAPALGDFLEASRTAPCVGPVVFAALLALARSPHLAPDQRDRVVDALRPLLADGVRRTVSDPCESEARLHSAAFSSGHLRSALVQAICDDPLLPVGYSDVFYGLVEGWQAHAMQVLLFATWADFQNFKVFCRGSRWEALFPEEEATWEAWHDPVVLSLQYTSPARMVPITTVEGALFFLVFDERYLRVTATSQMLFAPPGTAAYGSLELLCTLSRDAATRGFFPALAFAIVVDPKASLYDAMWYELRHVPPGQAVSSQPWEARLPGGDDSFLQSLQPASARPVQPVAPSLPAGMRVHPVAPAPPSAAVAPAAPLSPRPLPSVSPRSVAPLRQSLSMEPCASIVPRALASLRRPPPASVSQPRGTLLQQLEAFRRKRKEASAAPGPAAASQRRKIEALALDAAAHAVAEVYSNPVA